MVMIKSLDVSLYVFQLLLKLYIVSVSLLSILFMWHSFIGRGTCNINPTYTTARVLWPTVTRKLHDLLDAPNVMCVDGPKLCPVTLEFGCKGWVTGLKLCDGMGVIDGIISHLCE